MTDQSFRIASYNIRKARGLDQKRRPERTLAVINRLDADIVVLQEADKRLGPRRPALPRDMIEAETDFHLVEVCENGISIGWHGNAVLVRNPDRVARATRLDLPGLEPRGAVQLELDVGGGVTVLAAHLGLRRRDRIAQLTHLAKTSEHTARVVIAGDFNEWSQEKGFEPLQHRFDIHAPGHSFHARRPIAALDRFALSGGLTLRDAGVSQDRLARVASDHLPVWSDIELTSVTR